MSDTDIFRIWISFFFILIVPLILLNNYLFLKKSEGGASLRRILNPFSPMKIDRNRLEKKDKLVTWITISLGLVWFAMPYIYIHFIK